MGRGVGAAAGAAADGDEGDGLPEPQARWKSSPAEINEMILVVWGNPVILEMDLSLMSIESDRAGRESRDYTKN